MSTIVDMSIHCRLVDLLTCRRLSITELVNRELVNLSKRGPLNCQFGRLWHTQGYPCIGKSGTVLFVCHFEVYSHLPSSYSRLFPPRSGRVRTPYPRINSAGPRGSREPDIRTHASCHCTASYHRSHRSIHYAAWMPAIAAREASAARNKSLS